MFSYSVNPRPLGTPRPRVIRFATLITLVRLVSSPSVCSPRTARSTARCSAGKPAFLRVARPILERFASYFRPEVRGFERLPQRGPFLVVGNHSGGQMPPDLPVLLTAWWRERGEDEPVYALFHSFFLEAVAKLSPARLALRRFGQSTEE